MLLHHVEISSQPDFDRFNSQRLFSQPTSKFPRAKVSVERGDQIYSCGETVRISYGIVDGGKYIPGIFMRCHLEREGCEEKNFSLISEDRPLILETSMDNPGFIFFACQAGDDLDTRETTGVAVEPEKIQAAAPPPDFETFWAARKEELAKIPMECTTFRKVNPTFHHFDEILDVWDVRIECTQGIPVSGYMAMPKNAKPKSLPIYVYLHGAGVSLSCQSLPMAANGFIAFNMNALGLPNDLTPDELNAARIKNTAYWNRIYKSPKDSLFVPMVQRVLRALEFLKTQNEWDGRNIILHGGSQGGFQTLAGAALDQDVSMIVCQSPAMCNQAGALEGRKITWPRTVGTDSPEHAGNTPALYCDGANFARLAKAQALFTVGFADEAAVPSSVYATCNAYAGEKQIVNYPKCGHGGAVFWSGEAEILEFVKLNSL